MNPTPEAVKEAIEWFDSRRESGWHYNEKGAVLVDALAEKEAEVERLKTENATQYKNIASLQSRLDLQAEVVEAAKRTSAWIRSYCLTIPGHDVRKRELDAALAKLGGA